MPHHRETNAAFRSSKSRQIPIWRLFLCHPTRRFLPKILLVGQYITLFINIVMYKLGLGSHAVVTPICCTDLSHGFVARICHLS